MTPKRVQLSRKRGWRKPPNTVVVSRPSRYGNPFVVEFRDGAWYAGGKAMLPFQGRIWERFATKEEAQAWAVELFERHTLPTLDVSDLRGKDVGCWCSLGSSCHGDPVLRKANS